jgi:hypothetical protein
MSKETIRDKHYKTLGYIETMSDGKQKALDAHYKTLGYYDPKRNVTEDAHYRKLAQGNVLASLIYK